MKMNRDVKRPTAMIDGNMELCLQVFGGIHLYTDEAEGVRASVNKTRKIDDAADLNAVLDEQRDMVASHAASREMNGDVAGAASLSEEAAMLEDTHVPEHEMPIVPLRAPLKRSYSFYEQTQSQLRAQVAIEKEVADNVDSVRTPKKKKCAAAAGQPKVTATMKKDAIAARASAERVVTSHQEILDTLHMSFAC